MCPIVKTTTTTVSPAVAEYSRSPTSPFRSSVMAIIPQMQNIRTKVPTNSATTCIPSISVTSLVLLYVLYILMAQSQLVRGKTNNHTLTIRTGFRSILCRRWPKVSFSSATLASFCNELEPSCRSSLDTLLVDASSKTLGKGLFTGNWFMLLVLETPGLSWNKSRENDPSCGRCLSSLHRRLDSKKFKV